MERIYKNPQMVDSIQVGVVTALKNVVVRRSAARDPRFTSPVTESRNVLFNGPARRYFICTAKWWRIVSHIARHGTALTHTRRLMSQPGDACMFMHGPTRIILHCVWARVPDPKKTHRVFYRMHLLARTFPCCGSLPECGQSFGVPLELHEHDPQAWQHRAPWSPIPST